MVKKNKQNKQKGGKADLIKYDAGGTDLGSSKGFVPYFENIGGEIVWTINSIIAATNVIGDLINLPGDMGTAWGSNTPPELK